MDDVLIEKIQNGNDHAFRVLVEKYRNVIFHAVYGVLRNEKDAEDATQEVFIKIYTSLPQYEKQGFKTWITRIAVNHAIDMKRKKVRRKEDQQVEYDEVGLAPQPSPENVELKIIKKERQQLLRQRIKELPDNYREVVEEYYLHDRTYQEIAEKQQARVKTVEVKLYRARQWMKKHWKEDDFS